MGGRQELGCWSYWSEIEMRSRLGGEERRGLLPVWNIG
jgi:hypothetical protein